jgi:hypothetical protein
MLRETATNSSPVRAAIASDDCEFLPRAGRQPSTSLILACQAPAPESRPPEPWLPLR